MVAHRLEHLTGPPCLAELRTDILRSGGKLGGERLVHKLAYRRIRAFHEQPLELNHDLNDLVRVRSSLGRKNAGILQRRQQRHGSADRSGRRAPLRLHQHRHHPPAAHEERQPDAGRMHGAIIQKAGRGHQLTIGEGR